MWHFSSGRWLQDTSYLKTSARISAIDTIKLRQIMTDAESLLFLHSPLFIMNYDDYSKTVLPDSSVISPNQWVWKTASRLAWMSIMVICFSLVLTNDYKILHIHCGFRWLTQLHCAKATVSDHRHRLLDWHWLRINRLLSRIHYMAKSMQAPFSASCYVLFLLGCFSWFELSPLV